MKFISNFFKSFKPFAIWTAGYIFVLWAILKFLFNFSIFSTVHWHHLAHMRLHGFSALVFGAIIFAAIPLYIASCALVIKKNQLLLEIPSPKWIKKINITKLFSTPPKTSEPPTPAPTTTAEPAQEPEDDMSEIPLEMHAAFKRAKLHPIKIVKQTKKDTNDDNTHPVNTTDALPLPSDFDIQMDEAFDEEPISIPTFSDITFDGYDEDNTEDKDTPPENPNITITKTHAIVTHNDPDFFVTDDDNWFATGKTLPSPIAAVLKAAQEHNVKPVIHLAQANILDLETLIEKWESDGITVITDLSQL